MTSDDNRDDDAQLRQLRAVWVSMRDEEPPDHGLAALMAAARTKAAELEQAARPSWWQRAFAALRRPPVLALATVTLLLGGALIVTQRRAEMKADGVVTTETSEFSSKGGHVAPVPGGEQPEATATPSAGFAAPVVPDLAKPPEVVAESSPADPKPATKASLRAKAIRPTSLGKEVDVPPTDPSATVAAGQRGAGGSKSLELSIASDDAAENGALREEVATGQAQPEKPPARPAPSPIEGEHREPSKIATDSAKRPPPSLDQLVKQCETAAARGDCAAVRQIAQKIQTSAPAAYKTRVANNAALHRCLPASSANSVSD